MNKSLFAERRVFVILAIFLLSIAVRVLTAEYIDIGGDNAARWTYVLGLLQGVDMQLSHHSARWGIVIPLWGVMKLFGTNPANYYILPILFASLGTVMLYLIGERLGGYRLGLMSALLTILFPQMTQSGSQLWPSIFQFAFIAFAVWVLLLWQEKQKTEYIVAAAVAFFLAWGTRLTAVYFIPGLLLFIWFPVRKFKPVFTFCVLVGLLCSLEWIAFWLYTGNPMGRLGVIQSTALTHHVTYTAQEYFLNFLNYKKLRGLLPILILTVVAACIMLRRQDWRWRNLAMLYLAYLFLLTYMISGINPLRRAGDPSTRFWCAAAPFGLLLLCQWLLELQQRYSRTAKTLLVILFIAFFAFTVKKIPATNSLIQVARDHAILSPVISAREPVMLYWEPWRPNAVEGILYDLFGVTKRPRGSSPGQVKTALLRGKHRLLAFNMKDMREYYVFLKSDLVQVDDFSFLYVPPGATPDQPAGASVYFDRRHAYAMAAP